MVPISWNNKIYNINNEKLNIKKKDYNINRKKLSIKDSLKRKMKNLNKKKNI